MVVFLRVLCLGGWVRGGVGVVQEDAASRKVPLLGLLHAVLLLCCFLRRRVAHTLSVLFVVSGVGCMAPAQVRTGCSCAASMAAVFLPGVRSCFLSGVFNTTGHVLLCAGRSISRKLFRVLLLWHVLSLQGGGV
jgi:hypothetical protein